MNGKSGKSTPKSQREIVEALAQDPPEREPGAQRSDDQVLTDQAAAWRLHLRGCNMTQIAEKLGLSRQTVARDLDAVREELRETRIRDVDTLRDVEIAKLNMVEFEAWEQYERSKLDKKKVTRKTKAAKDSEAGEQEMETTVQVEGQRGDPRYLEVITNASNLRMELQGIKKPKQLDMTSGGKSLAKELTDAELAAIAAGHAADRGD